MRLQLTVFLLVLNLALFGALFYVHTQQEKARTEQLTARQILSPEFLDAVHTLTLQNGDRRPLWQLVRDQEDWVLEQPIEWATNPFAVDRIQAQLRYLEWEARISQSALQSSGQTLADFGLENPQAALTLQGPDGIEALHLGAPTDVANRFYLQRAGQDDVYVVHRRLLDSLLVGVDTLRRAELFDIPLFEIRSLSIQTGGDQRLRVLLRRQSDSWQFEAPIRTDADNARTVEILHNLLATSIVRFTDQNAASYPSLGNPSLRITLESSSRRQTLLVGATVDLPGSESAPVRVAQMEGSPSAFLIRDVDLQTLRQAQETLRERRFLQFEAQALTQLEIRLDGENTTLQKLEGGDWQILLNQEGNILAPWPADPAIMEDLILNLQLLEAARFQSDAPSAADLSAFGFDQPLRRIVLSLGAAHKQTLLIGNYLPDENRYYAKLDSRPFVYVIDPGLLARTPLDPLAYRHRLLNSLPDSARIITLELRNTAQEQTLLSYPGDPTGPEDAARQQALATLLDFIRQTRVKDYVRTEYSDAFTLDADSAIPWSYQLRARVDLNPNDANGPQTFAFDLTERLGGTTQFAGSERFNVLFSLPQEIIDALHAFTFDRAAPQRQTVTQSAAPPP